MRGLGFILVSCLCMVSCQASPPTPPTATPTNVPVTPTLRASPIPPTLEPTLTASPQPSATVLPPTLSPSPVPLFVSATQNINVRNGPGTNFSVIGKLEQGKTALVTGQNANSEWWQIAYPTNDERGWVAAQFTTVNGATTSVAIVELPTPAQSETTRPTSAPVATTAPIAVDLIAFQSTMNSPTFDIYTIKPDSTELRRLTDAPGNDQFPSWSPDAEQIVFSSDRDGQNEIYVMNADGTNQQRLVPHTEEDLVPRWSHDGKSIAFFSTRDGKSIFVMNPDGSNVRKVITNENITFEYGAFRLAWSPDDQMLAYTAGEPGGQTLYLYVINLDGTLVQRYFDLSAPEWKWFESFSPDGRYQIIRTVGFGPQEIIIVDAGTQANRRKLIDGAEGRWSPR